MMGTVMTCDDCGNDENECTLIESGDELDFCFGCFSGSVSNDDEDLCDGCLLRQFVAEVLKSHSEKMKEVEG